MMQNSNDIERCYILVLDDNVVITCIPSQKYKRYKIGVLEVVTANNILLPSHFKELYVQGKWQDGPYGKQLFVTSLRPCGKPAVIKISQDEYYVDY